MDAPLIPSSTTAVVLDRYENMDVLRVFGELDLACAKSLEKQIMSAATSGKKLAIDMTQCGYIDTTIISVLVRVRKALHQRLTVVVTPTGAVDRVFALTGLHDSLGIVERLEVEGPSS